MLLFHHLVQARLAGSLNALAYIFQTADLIQIRQTDFKSTSGKSHIQCPVQHFASKRGRSRSKLTC